ncbi:MAG: hypothetical protein A7315_13570 [Candidatus Altiarchaeales archaeon WOR_SM1_79]|nr:MAG: hypothetical protein A7315_13570 [Candidatus Altiarchaeales archaeon WOR_SM1_79]
MKIIAAIPAHNEEATIGSVVLRAKKYVDKVIVVDDGSRDDTAEIAELAGAEVVMHKKNKGKGAALKSGFKKAKEFNPDFVVCLDSDAQHNPDEIPVLINTMINEDADIVIGSRFLKKSVKNLPSYRRFGQKVLDFFTNIVSGTNISDTQSGFRCFSKKSIEKLRFNQTGLDTESGILAEAKEHGLKTKEVSISVRYDLDKTSKKHPISHGLGIIVSIIKIISERHPLMFFGITGTTLLMVGLFSGYSVVVTFNKSPNNELAIGTALITLLLIISGMFLMLTGVILYTIQDIIRRYMEKE